MADFSAVRLNTTWPPGYVTYPDAVNTLITLNETTANEIFAARENESSLVVNLQNNYLTSTLTNNIVGNGFKFINMPDGVAASDYATVSQVQAMSTGLPTVAALDNTGTGAFEVLYSEFKVTTAGSGGTFGTFEYNSSSLSGSSTMYLTAFNKTYRYDWGSAPTLVDLNNINTPTPTKGDRIRFVFTNTRTGDGIQAGTSLIHGLSEKITFGAAFSHAIYDLVYVGLPTGWFFKNVILG